MSAELERDRWTITVDRGGMWPGVWQAEVSRNGRCEKTLEAVTIGRVIRKARRYVSRYVELTVSVA